MPDWRDEVIGALDHWIGLESRTGAREGWTKVGEARQLGDPGWYTVDARRVNADLDQGRMRVAGTDQPGEQDGFPVLETVQDGQTVRVRIAEFASIEQPHLWCHRQAATFLLTRLRDGIAALPDVSLASDLASRRLAGYSTAPKQLAGFSAAQREVYAACFSPGVRLVWGPPGTGKTRILTEAISDLAGEGRTVLLVSATNIAVDNALLGVVRRGGFRRGQLLRVGVPHLAEIANNPDVCLNQLVLQELAQAEDRRLVIQAQLVAILAREAELGRVQRQLAGFDPHKYHRVSALLDVESRIPGLAAAAADARQVHADLAIRKEEAERRVERARVQVEETAQARRAYAEIARLRKEVSALSDATDSLHATLVLARRAGDTTAARLAVLTSGSMFFRMRNRAELRRLRQQREVDAAEQLRAETEWKDARALLERRGRAVESQVSKLTAEARYQPADLVQRDRELAAAEQEAGAARKVAAAAETRAAAALDALLTAEAQPRATSEERSWVSKVASAGLPELARRAATMSDQREAVLSDRSRLEQEHAEAHDEVDKLRRGAETSLISQATVVATTLARFRSMKALLDRQHDVVLIDEAGAANLPEVLHAVGHAGSTAVLLGDFMQLGPIISSEVLKDQRPDLVRWLHNDVFAHCGIGSADEARARTGCVALDTQHRFGPVVMTLANRIAYDGLLKAGPNQKPHVSDDPEIVFVDTDGLGDLARVRPTSARAGWWPAGSLLSRVLVDYHLARGEQVGVVTPYKHQAEATLEALRDAEGPNGTTTEVGTAHRFQGREFPIVVFDLVEDEWDKRWMFQAERSGGSWARTGVRLFNVALTRTQHRIYLIGSRTRVASARPGSPLGHLHELLVTCTARVVRASSVISAQAGEVPPEKLGVFGSELAGILAQHVRISDIHDERDFNAAISGYLDGAKESIWLWAPWTARRVRTLLPALVDAVGRGVRVTVFTRGESDQMQRGKLAEFLAEVREDLPTVVAVHEMHQKIVIIDERTVLLGSLNTLSHSSTREVMLAIEGRNFARKLLEHEHAKEFVRQPPRCGRCGTAGMFDLRRLKADWAWVCRVPAGVDEKGHAKHCSWKDSALRKRPPLVP
ncbi:AAA domain-containing protein [Longispora albida]|uniref:AAA domain-containing protein n=1 Tax=Longispora albida TaxID=203523 RepID=UPI00037D1880|nr:AAA domain-containing protein [Longispora albida]